MRKAGFTLQEIAEEMDCSHNTIKYRLDYAEKRKLVKKKKNKNKNSSLKEFIAKDPIRKVRFIDLIVEVYEKKNSGGYCRTENYKGME